MVEDEELASSLKPTYWTDKWIFYIFLAIIVIVPIVIGAHIRDIPSPLITESSVLSTGTKLEFFSYFKFIFLLFLTLIALLLFMYKVLVLKYDIPRRKMFIGLFLFIAFMVVSTFLADYKTVAVLGQMNRQNGALTMTLYFLLMFIAMNIDYPRNALRDILYSLYPLVFVNFFIFIMHFTGHDLFNYSWFETLVTTFIPYGMTVGSDSFILGTINQWNFMSGMFSVVTTLFLAAAILEKHKVAKIVHLVVALLSVSILFMSQSTSGNLTLMILILFLLVMALRMKNWKKSIAMIAAFICFSIPILHVLATESPKVWNETVGMFGFSNPYLPDGEDETDAIIGGHSFDWDWFNLKKENYDADEFYLPNLPERGISAGTGRVYIWVKTLALVSERPFFGYGLDTIMYHFPHFNIDARAGLRTEGTIVDKPHNFYLSILFGTGILGFLAFMSVILWTVWRAIMMIWHVQKVPLYTSALASAWLAFLCQSVFNDSFPGVSSLGFLLGGIMMAFSWKRLE